MPIKVQSNLPAIKILETENIFVMPNEVALRQDIRPLKILILNLMPTKIATETQLLRLLGNSPLQVDIELLQMASHTSKNTSPQHLTTFYKTFEEVRDDTFDGLIITGAPVEQIPFEEVDYWEELCELFEFAKTHVYSSMFSGGTVLPLRYSEIRPRRKAQRHLHPQGAQPDASPDVRL